MTAKNIYTNIANITNLSDVQGEVTPKTTIFSSIPGENVVFDIEGILKYPVNISSLQAQPLNELARHVLGVIGSYEYVTTKMITDCLNLLGIPVDSKHILTACERLRKTGLIHAFRFKCDDNCKPAGYIVYTVSKLAGENALHSLGIVINQVDNYNIVMDPANVKKKLITNQILFANFKHNNEIVAFEKSKRYAVADKITGEKVAAKSSLTISFNDKSSICYEVVRKSCFWKTEFENKLRRYKTLQDSEAIPDLIICCEDEEHAREVNKMVQDIHLKAFFTHDLMFFGENFNHHLFTVSDSGEILYFKISFDEKKNNAE
mgnify:CR=1 FL=1